METVVAFAQSVYLIFASVYVCKETVEHLLLSSGEGHHHHSGDEVQEFFGSAIRSDVLAVYLTSYRVDFPFRLLLVTLASLLTTTFAFDNHSKLVSSTYVQSLHIYKC